MILPTYVELVWGCSNASFGILRPGFRFLPIGKDVRIKFRSVSEHSWRDSDGSRRKGLTWEQSSPLRIGTVLPTHSTCERQAPKRQAEPSFPKAGHGHGWGFSPVAGENVSVRIPTLFTSEDLAFLPDEVLSFHLLCSLLYTTMVMVDGVGYIFFLIFSMSVKCSHPDPSIPQFSKLICEQLTVNHGGKIKNTFPPSAQPILNHLPGAGTPKGGTGVIFIYMCPVPKRIKVTDGLM